MPADKPTEVLIIDDSAVVRQVLRELLEQERDLRVTTAADPLIALSKIEKNRPDVIVLDIVMPRMDGLTFLERLRETDRIPVVICSGHVQQDSERALRALQLGATEIVSKPRIGIQQFLQESRVLIADAVRAASQIHRRQRRLAAETALPRVTSGRRIVPGTAPLTSASVQRVQPATQAGRLEQRGDNGPIRRRPTSALGEPRSASAIEVIALGASTGGPQALESIFRQLPREIPGIVAVQHMPEGFTRAFARRLDTTCGIAVKEAENGDAIKPGRALIAPGNHHLLVHRQGVDLFVEVTSGPLVSRHRPSVNVLFRSVAMAAGSDAIGVLMTGMGDDGAEGLLEMRRVGAYTIAQDQESSTVFGMPRSAIENGASVEVVGLDEMASTIIERARFKPLRLPRASEWT